MLMLSQHRDRELTNRSHNYKILAMRPRRRNIALQSCTNLYEKKEIHSIV